MILPWAGYKVPQGWLVCDGSLLPITNEYSYLFNVIGTKYGGNGTSNFALPNLSGRVAVGDGYLPMPGGGTFVQGTTSGNIEIQLTSNNIPPHTHTINAGNQPGVKFTGSATVQITASTDNSTIGSSVPTNNAYLGPCTGAGKAGGLYFSTLTAGKTATLSGGVVNTSSLNVSGSTDSTGLSEYVNIMQPYTVIKYIICYQGVFPQFGD